MARPLTKDSLIRFRISSRLKEIIKQEADKKGLTISEWIIKVLKEKLKVD